MNTLNRKQFNTSRVPTNYKGTGVFETSAIVEPTHGVSGYQSTGVVPNSYETQVRATPSFVTPNIDPATSGYGVQSHTVSTQVPRYSGRTVVTPSTVPTGISLNREFDDEELTLQAGLEQGLEYQGESRSRQQDQIRGGGAPSGFSEGINQFDPAIQSMIQDEDVTQNLSGKGYHQPSDYFHSATGVPSTTHHHPGETATQNTYTGQIQLPNTGSAHHDLVEIYNPTMPNESNAASGTHFAHADAPQHQTSGTLSFSMSKERPLTLRDFANPPQPNVIAGSYVGRPTSTSASMYV